MTSRDYWKGKRIAVVGLGPHGELVEDVKFLIKAGALVGIYDLKSEARLKNHLVFLRTIGLANYVCGSIPADDLVDNDLIVLSHEYPRESGFLRSAKEKGIQIEYPETLFFKQAPPVTVVGIMGEVGKSTVTSMLTPMLEAACKQTEEQGFFVLDPDSEDGVLANLRKIKNGDLVLMRITPMIMRELYAIRISPQVAVFTTVPGKMAYTKSPFEILEFQTYNNFVIASDEIIDAARGFKELPRAKMLRTKISLIPPDWDIPNIPVENRTHDRENAALALQAAMLFKVDMETARCLLIKWKPLRARIELVKKIKNVEFYNDSSAVTAQATVAALKTIANGKGNRDIVLIFGGAEGAEDYRPLYSMIAEYVHTIILLPGSGTIRERRALHALENIVIHSVPNVEEATRIAMEHARKGDKVLFSPGFEAAGLDSSRRERAERFVKAVRNL